MSAATACTPRAPGPRRSPVQARSPRRSPAPPARPVLATRTSSSYRPAVPVAEAVRYPAGTTFNRWVGGTVTLPLRRSALRAHPALERPRRLQRLLHQRWPHLPLPARRRARQRRAAAAGPARRRRRAVTSAGGAAGRPTRRRGAAAPGGAGAGRGGRGAARPGRPGRVLRAQHPAGRRAGHPAPAGRPGRPDGRARHALQRPVLGLRQHPDGRRRARDPRPGPAVHRGAPVPGLRGQRARAALAEHRHGPAGRVRRAPGGRLRDRRRPAAGRAPGSPRLPTRATSRPPSSTPRWRSGGRTCT